jgi:hypothetical protein
MRVRRVNVRQMRAPSPHPANQLEDHRRIPLVQRSNGQDFEADASSTLGKRRVRPRRKHDLVPARPQPFEQVQRLLLSATPGTLSVDMQRQQFPRYFSD